MKKNTQSILKDLYKLDPELKKQEKKLIKLIEKLLSAKPDLKINSEFARMLRVRLIEKAEKLKITSPSLSFINTLKRFVYPFAGGVVVTALIFVTILAIRSDGLLFLSVTKNDSEGSKIAFETDVTKLSDGAFGKLGGISAETMAESAVSNAVDNEGDVATSDIHAFGRGGGSMPDSDAKIMDPYYGTQYKYTYKGTWAELTDEKVNVYRRKISPAHGDTLARTAQSLGFGTIDITGFKNLSAQNITLMQNEKNGYVINMDFSSNSINIYQNWEQWPQPYNECNGDQKCYERLQLKKSDVPSDQEIIKISDAFLKKHGADTSFYGKPVINKYWENMMTAYEPEFGSQVYIPDEIEVVYPLLPDGNNTVYDSGNPYGLNVSVNIRQKSVANVNNLKPNSFESSQYSAITDFQDILDHAEKGGSYYYQHHDGVKITEVELGEPEKVMVVLFRPSAERKNIYEEYFVPALRFPISEKPDEYLYRNYVVVPLVKEMLEEPENPIAVPMVRFE